MIIQTDNTVLYCTVLYDTQVLSCKVFKTHFIVFLEFERFACILFDIMYVYINAILIGVLQTYMYLIIS